MLDIKRCIEEFKPDGFSLKTYTTFGDTRYHLITNGVNWNLGLLKEFTPKGEKIFYQIYYPLFLQRVIEGINKNSESIIISVSLDFIDVKFLFEGETVACQNFRISYKYIDQAKEQAIKYILSKI